MPNVSEEQLKVMAKELAKKIAGSVKEIERATADAEKEADLFETAAAK